MKELVQRAFRDARTIEPTLFSVRKKDAVRTHQLLSSYWGKPVAVVAEGSDGTRFFRPVELNGNSYSLLDNDLLAIKGDLLTSYNGKYQLATAD